MSAVIRRYRDLVIEKPRKFLQAEGKARLARTVDLIANVELRTSL